MTRSPSSSAESAPDTALPSALAVGDRVLVEATVVTGIGSFLDGSRGASIFARQDSRAQTSRPAPSIPQRRWKPPNGGTRNSNGRAWNSATSTADRLTASNPSSRTATNTAWNSNGGWGRWKRWRLTCLNWLEFFAKQRAQSSMVCYRAEAEDVRKDAERLECCAARAQGDDNRCRLKGARRRALSRSTERPGRRKPDYEAAVSSVVIQNPDLDEAKRLAQEHPEELRRAFKALGRKPSQKRNCER